MSTVRPTSARRDKPRVLYAGVGLALGCGVGAALGVIFGPMGVIIGAGIGNAAGLLIGAVVDWRLAGTRSVGLGSQRLSA
jgi:hypothetical protein